MRTESTILKKYNEIVERLHTKEAGDEYDRDSQENDMGYANALLWVLGKKFDKQQDSTGVANR